ncbi:MAG: endonuclease MutS2, partial [Oscillospiraceae bacterium]|nr:endonuclease MutS2 [Oscillospiraceae bacterium]
MLTRDHLALELDKVLAMLAAEATLPDAAAQAQAQVPSADPGEVRRRLDATIAAVDLTARFGAPNFSRAKPVAGPLRRAAAGGILSMKELLEIAGTLRAVRAVVDWRRRCENYESCLDEAFSLLAPNKYLEDKITAAILSEDEIADHASPELATIRRKIRAASARAREQLDRMVRSPAYQKLLQDPIVTIRDGRFVVPVKQEHRAEVPGLVHDTSGSGATLFVEPMAVVEANNEIRILQSREADEIERILAALSAEAGTFADAIIADYDTLVALNLIFAKAHLAYNMKASAPNLSDGGFIKLVRARYPLIDPKKVVPVDVELGGGFDTLVITGPNTGGKTVTLKTLGL